MKRALAVVAGVALVSCTEVAAPPSSQLREIRAPNSAVVTPSGAIYTAIDVGSLGGNTAQAAAINETGQIAAFGSNADNNSTSVFRWEAGVMTLLPSLGGKYAYPYAINAAGDIVGWSYVSDNSTYHAALWNGHGVTDLGVLRGDAGSYAQDVNDHGQIIGTSWGATNRGFIWQAGVMTELAGLGRPNYVLAADINNNGDVAGFSDSKAVMWHNGTVAALTVLPGTVTSAAYYINDAGQLAGYIDYGSGSSHAVLWTNGAPTDLGDLGGGRSFPTAMNESGDVVGWSSLPSGDTHAFLWHNGRMTDLGDLGYPYSVAADVNDRGQVTGSGYLPDGSRHAFLWESGIMTDLGTLGGANAYPTASHSMNNAGQVVGASTARDQTEHAALWSPSTTLAVTIDIKPGSTPNSVNPKAKGVIPVAVLSVGGFDATTIDVSTVKFGPGEASEAHGKGHVEDANGDGVPDMVLHFDTQASGITCGMSSATLTGKTVGGTQIKGSDAVATTGCK